MKALKLAINVFTILGFSQLLPEASEISAAKAGC
jgi:hypothetical protein